MDVEHLPHIFDSASHHIGRHNIFRPAGTRLVIQGRCDSGQQRLLSQL